MRDPSEDRRVLRGEWPALLLSMGFFFCVLTAYYVIRPLRDQLSAAVGSTQLPWFYAATFLATLALTPLFAALVSRYPRRVVVPAVYGVFIACLLGFVPLFANEHLLGPRELGTVFFVWISVFNLFAVSVFWIFMSDVWTPERARRLFPLIAFAGTVGAITGPAITGNLVTVVGIPPLLVVSAALLALAAGCSLALGRRARDHRLAPGRERDAPVGGGMLDGLRQLFASPFMRTMALLLLLADGIGTVNYALLVDYSGAAFDDPRLRTAFAADVDLAANSLTMLLQLGVTWWMLPRFGAGPLIMLWALINAAGLSLVAFSGDPHAIVLAGLPAVAITAILGRALAFGLAEPARHSLFTLVPRNERYKGQNAVDTAVWRFGDLVVALTMNGLRGLGAGTAGLAGMGAVAAAAAAITGWRLSRRGSAHPLVAG